MKARCLLLLCLILILVLWFQSSCSADTCPTCGGTGTIVCTQCGGTGIAEWVDVHGQPGAYGCEACGGVRGSPWPGTTGYGTGKKGSGYITCPTCGGSGLGGKALQKRQGLPR